MKKKKSVGRPKSEVRSSSASTYCSNGSADSMVEGQESVEEALIAEAAEGSAEGNGMIDSTVRTGLGDAYRTPDFILRVKVRVRVEVRARVSVRVRNLC
eukprot:1353222-Amorphochlora_amoeboformis.AAC.3